MSRILILEPDRQLAANTKKYLEMAGHFVSVHSDLQSAISLADQQIPDLIILNLILAGRSATEFLYELRSYPDWQQLPVIILSQLPEHELQSYQPSLELLNVSRCLYKPDTSLSQLAQEIEAQLQVTA